MKVLLDLTKCKGMGACADECPSVFQLDEFGYAELKVEGGVVPDGDEKAAEAAARACPEKAIETQD